MNSESFAIGGDEQYKAILSCAFFVFHCNTVGVCAGSQQDVWPRKCSSCQHGVCLT